MAKLKTDPIVESDLIEYLNISSDFAFEQQVLRTLLALGFESQHAGTYTDPSTGTPREFDIRGLKWVSDNWNTKDRMNLRVAVECKNIAESFPLLVECVPRTRDESFHEIIQSRPTTSASENWNKSRVVRDSVYREGQPVGKSCCQVGRTPSDGISSSDSGVYTKWAQALASIFDLFEISKTNHHFDKKLQLTALIPFVVVPDDRLWMVEYDGEGNRIAQPHPTDHVSYWVNKPLSDARNTKGHLHWFTISHIEFCTESGLRRILTDYSANPSHHLFSVRD